MLIADATPNSVVQHAVTVVDYNGSNKYAIDGVQQDSLNLVEGNTYIFDWSAASGHPFRLSTNADGTHDSAGMEYTNGVVVDVAAALQRLRLQKVRQI